MKPIQHIALQIQLTLGRIEILGDVFFSLESSSTKRNDLTADVVDGKHHTTAEEVVDLSIALSRESGFNQVGKLVLLFESGLRHGVPLIRTIAELKLLNDIIPEAAFVKIGETYRASFLAFNELLLEVACSEFGDDTQLLTFTFLL